MAREKYSSRSSAAVIDLRFHGRRIGLLQRSVRKAEVDLGSIPFAQPILIRNGPHQVDRAGKGPAFLGRLNQGCARGNAAAPVGKEIRISLHRILESGLFDDVIRIGHVDGLRRPGGRGHCDLLIGRRNRALRNFRKIGVPPQFDVLRNDRELLRGVEFFDLAPIDRNLAQRDRS